MSSGFPLREGRATALGGLIASGVNLAPVVAQAQELRIKDAKVTPERLPVLLGGLRHARPHRSTARSSTSKATPRSPHNEGTLCPKGAATFQLHVNPNRPTQVLHRAPGAADWEVWDLEARDGPRRRAGEEDPRRDLHRAAPATARSSTRRPAIFSLGGATLDIEWNHIQQKLMRGLGIVAIENQARI